jgi:hypothetical protein|tara:strand:+ start:2235 stop:2816 length:582 start_codon:yes stop_codon:yes gene_type:complete
MNDLNEIESGQLCQTTIEALYEATGGLRHFPGLLKKIIANRAWERRVNKGRVIELGSLRELITSKPIRGWGEDPKKVEAVIKDHPEVLAMYREAMKLKRGPKDQESFDDNVIKTKGRDVGNSKAYTLSRLEREAPKLFKDVCDGKTTANAAAIKAGFRKKTFTVPAGDAATAMRSVLRHYSKKEILDALTLCK